MNAQARALLHRRAYHLFTLDAELGGYGWAQGTYGLTPAGHRVSWSNAGARAYCIAGMYAALCERRHLTIDELDELRQDVTRALGLPAGAVALEQWNDVAGRTLRDVLDAIAAAARACESEAHVAA